jgi:Family of unknown function (DUF5670)
MTNPAQSSKALSATISLSPIHGAAPPDSRRGRAKENDMLWTIFVILLILWLLGFTLHVGGALIHLILVIAVIMLIYNLIAGRRVV